MTTTITLELSDAVVEALATAEGLRRAEALLEMAFIDDDEDDPAAMAMSTGGDKNLSAEASARLRASQEQPFEGASETMKEAVRHWKRLTGKTSVLPG
jgi:hypothetical protein